MLVKNTFSLLSDLSIRYNVKNMMTYQQWRNILTGGPWTNYIKGPIPHFEFMEEFIIIKVLTIKLPLNTKQ